MLEMGLAHPATNKHTLPLHCARMAATVIWRCEAPTEYGPMQFSTHRKLARRFTVFMTINGVVGVHVRLSEDIAADCSSRVCAVLTPSYCAPPHVPTLCAAASSGEFEPLAAGGSCSRLRAPASPSTSIACAWQSAQLSYSGMASS